MTSLPAEISITCIKDETDFLAFKDAWNEFLTKSHPKHLFYRHEWFEATNKWHHGKCEPYILIIYENEQIIGICPLMSCPCKYGFLAYTLLGFMMIPVSPYQNVICNKEKSEIVFLHLSTYLSDHQSEWDMIDLRHLSNTVSADFLSNVNSRFTHAQILADQIEYDSLIETTSDWESYYHSRSRHLKKNNNNARNRLAKMGEISVSQFLPSSLDENTIKQVLSEITAVANNSWKTGTLNDLSTSSAQEYLSYLFHQPVLQQQLSIWILRLDATAIAYEIQLTESEHVYALHADFHNSYEHLSPGRYLNYCIAKWMFESRYSVYHMGPGGQSYKRAWENQQLPMHQIGIYGPSITSKLLRLKHMLSRPKHRR